MAKHADVYPLIQAELPGCPVPLLRVALNRIAGEICQRTQVWQMVLDELTLVPRVWRYELDLPPASRLVVMQSVRLDGVELMPLNDTLGRHEWGRRSGVPNGYTVLPQWDEMVLDPAPVAAGTLERVAALAPTLSAAEVPDVLVERYLEALAEGVKAQLKRMQGQSWTDPAGAEVCRQEFNRRVDEARIETAYGRVVGSLKVAPRRF